MRRFSYALVAATALGGLTASVEAVVLKFDFGSKLVETPTNYNNFSSIAAVTDLTNPAHITMSIPNAIDTSGSPTGISASFPTAIPTVAGPNLIFSPGNNNGGGTLAPTGAAAIFDALATQDSWFGSINFSSYPNPGPIMPFDHARLTFGGLDPSGNTSYNFVMLASRVGVGDNRETRFTITGNGAPVISDLNASNNASNVATINGIIPTAGGTITLDVTAGPNNTNGNKFFYLNALQLTSVPEPASMGLLGLGSLALVARRRRD